MSKILVFVPVVAAALFFAGLGTSPAHADPPGVPRTLDCGSEGTFDIVLGPGGFWRPAHVVGSPMMHIPTRLEFFSSPFGPAEFFKGGAVPQPASGLLTCSFDFTVPGLGQFVGEVDGFFTPARP